MKIHIKTNKINIISSYRFPDLEISIIIIPAMLTHNKNDASY
jgi:hypothetical protein